MNGELPDNPWSLVRFADDRQSGIDDPFPVTAIKTQLADMAFEDVLRWSGASLVRDPVDQRITVEVRSRSGNLIDNVSEVGGWPEPEIKKPALDSDGDGMPDDWEVSHGLDANLAADGAGDPDGDGYTNLEDYLNSLVSQW